MGRDGKIGSECRQPDGRYLESTAGNTEVGGGLLEARKLGVVERTCYPDIPEMQARASGI